MLTLIVWSGQFFRFSFQMFDFAKSGDSIPDTTHFWPGPRSLLQTFFRSSQLLTVPLTNHYPLAGLLLVPYTCSFFSLHVPHLWVPCAPLLCLAHFSVVPWYSVYTQLPLGRFFPPILSRPGGGPSLVVLAILWLWSVNYLHNPNPLVMSYTATQKFMSEWMIVPDYPGKASKASAYKQQMLNTCLSFKAEHSSLDLNHTKFVLAWHPCVMYVPSWKKDSGAMVSWVLWGLQCQEYQGSQS